MNHLMVDIFAIIPLTIDATASDWPAAALITAIVMVSVSAQYVPARVIVAANISFAVPLEFLRVALAGIAGQVLFGKWPAGWVCIGAGKVFFSIFGVVRSRKPSLRRGLKATG